MERPNIMNDSSFFCLNNFLIMLSIKKILYKKGIIQE